MATTSILNYLETTGKSVTTGADTQLGLSPLNRLQVETFLCETAIVKGQLVAVDVVIVVVVAVDDETRRSNNEMQQKCTSYGLDMSCRCH